MLTVYTNGDDYFQQNDSPATTNNALVVQYRFEEDTGEYTLLRWSIKFPVLDLFKYSWDEVEGAIS